MVSLQGFRCSRSTTRGEDCMKRAVQYGAYPIVLLSSVWGNLSLMEAEAGFLLATYLPVTIGTLLIIWLELQMPYRALWKPSGKEVAEDSMFLALVHVLWPKLLAMGVAFLLFDIWSARDWPTSAWWPREWPVPVQTIMMALMVDGTRYWLHRLSHEWGSLWRFHAVHHSPHRLYTLNVGRFHPIDKGLQFLLDSLPFIIMGVPPAVLSLYFVFYAVNGFFQHSNVDVKLGWLNYLMSGPELHRWHHSMWLQESNNNYGNHLIVWDWLFGTRYLPPDREVEALGLVNRQYPTGFMQQMAAPFHPGLDKEAV
ncbi:MAG: sterol desaturase family protein [Nitrospira sp.]|nr:MAG: sterol desaturase family protein [Nitrospira sp.]